MISFFVPSPPAGKALGLVISNGYGTGEARLPRLTAGNGGQASPLPVPCF
jgi:hypothetical protein